MSNMIKNIAVAIITPTHTKKSFEMGLQLAKKFDAELTIVECVYKIPPKLYFFETKLDKKIAQSQISKIKAESLASSATGCLVSTMSDMLDLTNAKFNAA